MVELNCVAEGGENIEQGMMEVEKMNIPERAQGWSEEGDEEIRTTLMEAKAVKYKRKDVMLTSCASLCSLCN